MYGDFEKIIHLAGIPARDAIENRIKRNLCIIAAGLAPFELELRLVCQGPSNLKKTGRPSLCIRRRNLDVFHSKGADRKYVADRQQLTIVWQERLTIERRWIHCSKDLNLMLQMVCIPANLQEYFGNIPIR
jgi:hypothetical protein